MPDLADEIPDTDEILAQLRTDLNLASRIHDDPAHPAGGVRNALFALLGSASMMDTALREGARLPAAWAHAQQAGEPGLPAPCEHDWRILGAQDATPWVVLGRPTAHTAVLGRCSVCGQVESWLLIGAWDMQQLTGGTDGRS